MFRSLAIEKLGAINGMGVIEQVAEGGNEVVVSFIKQLSSGLQEATKVKLSGGDIDKYIGNIFPIQEIIKNSEQNKKAHQYAQK